MKVMVLGADGYLGWPMSHYLHNKGHKVYMVDTFYKRSFMDQLKYLPF